MSPRPLPKIHLFLWSDFHAYFWRLFSACFAPPRGKHATKTRRLTGGWGVGGGGLARLIFTTAIAIWWFLQTYLISGHYSCWFLLVMKQPIFWHYLGFQVMAILCWAAKNSLRGTVWLLDPDLPWGKMLDMDPHWNQGVFRNTAWRCCGSMKFWHISGSRDPYLWVMDPDVDSDPAIFVSDLQNVKFYLLITFWRYVVHTKSNWKK